MVRMSERDRTPGERQYYRNANLTCQHRALVFIAAAELVERISELKMAIQTFVVLDSSSGNVLLGLILRRSTVYNNNSIREIV
jgi:hypothetical protein